MTPDVLVEALQGYIETLGDGSVLYYNAQGQLHRTGGPAAIHHNGTVAWYQNGELHREDGPAIIHDDGTEAWYQNGALHRVGGPAVIHPNGDEYWYQNGKRHRIDGPAIIRADGGSKAWYVRGSIMPYKDFQRRAALEDCHDT